MRRSSLRPAVPSSFRRPLTMLAGVLALAGAPARAQEPIVRATVGFDGSPQDSSSQSTTYSCLTADGRWFAFQSNADNLVAGDTNGHRDVFVRDFANGTTVRVSVATGGAQGNDNSDSPTISRDGRFVAFSSFADNLVAGDANHASDVFLHDRDPDGNGIFDEGNGVTERVSVRSNGHEARGTSSEPSISDDGNLVAFLSSAPNLVSNDNNNLPDVFVHDRATGTTERVSVASDGSEADGDCAEPRLSRDGTTVVFISTATNLVAPDTQTWDVFVHDRGTGTTRRASEAADGTQADNQSGEPSINGDGRWVTFRSQARNLDPRDNRQADFDVFLKDMATGAVTCITIDANGASGHSVLWSSLSADGARVAFESGDDTFVANDLNHASDIFVRDLATDALTCASVNCMGVPAGGDSGSAALSEDGRFVVFNSLAPDLCSGTASRFGDLYRNDLANPGVVAAWSNYGAGFAGTLGVPTLVVDAPPRFATTFDVVAGDSTSFFTVGFLCTGFARLDLPTNLGGSLLVDATWLQALVVPPGGLALPFTVPLVPELCGLPVDLQMVELDPGAAHGFSFTPGLELVIGR